MFFYRGTLIIICILKANNNYLMKPNDVIIMYMIE